MKQRDHQAGFSALVVSSFIVLAVTVLAVTGLVAYRHHKPSNATNSAATSQSRATTQPQNTVTQSAQPNSYQGWNIYNDTDYAAASGISLKYPTDWKINVPGVKAIGNTKSPAAVINERTVFLSSSETPQEEWNSCATNISADACGAAPGDKTLSSKASTINGLAVYTATMQNGYGTYHVTVIRGNKSTPDGIPFVEFTTTSNDPTALSTYAAIMATATLPS